MISEGDNRLVVNFNYIIEEIYMKLNFLNG